MVVSQLCPNLCQQPQLRPTPPKKMHEFRLPVHVEGSAQGVGRECQLQMLLQCQPTSCDTTIKARKIDIKSIKVSLKEMNKQFQVNIYNVT